MTLLSAYKAATPLKSGPASWVKEVTEPHLPKGWTKYVCMKNGKKISKLVQYRDSDGKKYKNLKLVEDYLSNIILRNSWQNVAPWNDFLKKMVTVKNQKPAFKMPNPVGRPRKDKQTLATKTSQISQPQPSLITPPPPPPQSQPLPVLPLPFSGGMASELMVTNHFRARKPPGPPGPASPEPVVQTPLPADEIKLEPEEYKEESTDVNPPTTLEIAVPPTTDNQRKTSHNDEKELVLPKIKTPKITPLNTSSQNLTVPTTDISKETSKKFQCSVCHIIFEDKKTLVKHLTVHQQCNICNILFKTKGTWIKHMENVHKDAIQKKKQDPKIIQKPAKVGNISSHVETIGNHKVATPNEVQESDDADAKESILEAVPIKLEASPILSDDQLSVNRKRLTSIGDVLVEDQNEIELSFSQKSLKKETEADGTTEIKEEPLNTSKLMLDESLDNSNMVMDESTASVVENTSLPDNGINKVNKDIDNVVNRESEKDINEVEKASEKSSIPVSTDNDEVALRWYEGTFFTCRVMKSSTETCGKEFTGRKPFRLHLGHDHGVKLKTNELNGLKSFASKSKEGTYKCKSCLKLVKHDLFGISHHLMKTHSLTLDDYAQQFETVQSCKTNEATKENYEDGKSIEPVQISKPDEGSKQNDVDVKKKFVEVTENPEIIIKKTKLNSQILLGEKHLKEYQKHIEELDVSNSTESVKISESSKQTDILKSELFERIAAIEREKETLLKKANEYDEVIMENLNQIAKIEQVNNNRKSILQKRSGEVMENIRKAKAELKALLNEKEEKMKMPVKPCNPASNKEENILVEAEQKSGLKKTIEEASQVESSIEPEPVPVLPVGVVEIKDEKGETLEKETDTVVTTTKATIEPTIIKEKSVLAIKENKLEPLENKQEVVGDDSIDKNKVSNEKPPQKGSILEQKINALKRKSVEMDLVKEPSSTACIVSEDNDSEGVSVDGDSSKAEGKIENSKAERGRKKRSEDVRKTLKDAHVDTSKVEGPVENSDVKVSQPKKRGRKKLSDEEKATRKALRIDSKRLSNSKPTVEGIENSFVFEDIETDIPGVACVPAIVITKDEDALKTHQLIEKKIDGKDTASNAFQNVQDSIQKSKKKMKKKVSGPSPQRAVRDLSDLFAEIEEESDMLEKKGDKKTKLEAGETKEKTDKATKGANQTTKNGLKKARGLAGTSKKSTNSRTKNLKKRKSIHMSNGNVEGAESIQNINKKGRNSL